MTIAGPDTVVIPQVLALPAGSLPVGGLNPEDWRDLLCKRLTDRWSAVKIYDEYYDGQHRLMFAGEKFRSEFAHLFRDLADNWTPIVVDAVEERCSVEGFRLGTATDGDKAAWDLWQRNSLDANSQIAHTESLIAGVSYVLVAPPGRQESVAQITIEHASEMIVVTAAGARQVRLAALKRWRDDTGRWMCTLYLPDYVYKWQSRGTSSSEPSDWVERTPTGETWPMANPFREVPVVPLRNRPRLRSEGQSELVGVVPMQDAVNKLLADMLTASEFAAFMQRWATGLELHEDKDGQPEAPFRVAVDRLLVSENPETRFGEFSATDLGNYVKAIEMIVQHVASQTRTPPHYFYLSGQFPSGESIKSAETGLVAKARRKMRHWGEGWEEVIRLAFAAVGDSRAEVVDAETIWADPESRTEAEHVDATLKKQALNVPDEQLWEDLGYSPQQIRRFAAMRARQTLANPFQAAPPAIPGMAALPAAAPQPGR